LFARIDTTAGLMPVIRVMVIANAASTTMDVLVPVRAASRREARCDAGES
jgi:hypothetical protein